MPQLSGELRQRFNKFVIEDGVGGTLVHEWNERLRSERLAKVAAKHRTVRRRPDRADVRDYAQEPPTPPQRNGYRPPESLDDVLAAEKRRLAGAASAHAQIAEHTLEDDDEMSKRSRLLTIYVQRDGAPDVQKRVDVEYLLKLPELAWPKLTQRIEAALEILNCGSVRHSTEGVFVSRIASLVDGNMYIVEPSDADVLLSTLIETHQETPAPGTTAVSLELKGDGGSTAMGTDADYARLNSQAYQRVARTQAAQAALNEAVSDAAFKGWAPETGASEAARRGVEDMLVRSDAGLLAAHKKKNKAGTRQEVLRRLRLDADLANTVATIAMAVAFLAERDKTLQKRLDATTAPDRETADYFKALDAVEAENLLVTSAPMPRQDIRTMYRNCVRWCGAQAVKRAGAVELVDLGVPERLVRYLDAGGPCEDDYASLRLALVFFANVAAHYDEACWAAVLSSGGLTIALALLHQRCQTLFDAQTEADFALRAESRVAAAAPRPPDYAPYNDRAGDSPHEPSQGARLRAFRIASAHRTIEDDSAGPDGVEVTHLHCWTLSLCLALARNAAARQTALQMLGVGRIIDVLAETALRWAKYRHVVRICASVSCELAGESEVLCGQLRHKRIHRLLAVAGARHRETEDVGQDVAAVLKLLDDGSADFTLDVKTSDNIGRLELPWLDGDASAYREYAIQTGSAATAQCHRRGLRGAAGKTRLLLRSAAKFGDAGRRRAARQPDATGPPPAPAPDEPRLPAQPLRTAADEAVLEADAPPAPTVLPTVSPRR
ncbi:hypothetical protein M885DRAFT_615305 [Pelagophyceae sp. CCMP2097]|nr:hypothetical protein M885DRAFT_615305 [Pelagophyceae sp. CCMP2097]